MELFKDPYGILALAAAKNSPNEEEEDSFWNKEIALQVQPSPGEKNSKSLINAATCLSAPPLSADLEDC